MGVVQNEAPRATPLDAQPLRHIRSHPHPLPLPARGRGAATWRRALNPFSFIAACLFAIVAITPAAALDERDRGEVEGMVRDYLVKHPEAIEDALKELSRKRQAELETRRADALKRRAADGDQGVHGVLGAADGDVTLVEFFDYNCGFCRRAIKSVDALIASDPKLKIVLYDLPVIRQESVGAAEVSIAVAALAPEKFRAFHETLLAEKNVVTREIALAAAKGLGLDAEALSAAASNPDVRSSLTDVKGFAQEIGVEATPTFVIGDAVVVNAGDVVDQLKARIAALRSCGKSDCG